MSNELIFLCAALIDIVFIFAVARYRIGLIATMFANLILVAIFGAKLIQVFGFVTNAGNVFYACVFLATHFFLERRGRSESLKTIWLGVAFMLFFFLMSQFATRFVGSPLSDSVNGAIHTLFVFSPRIIFASVIAYVFAQYVNISLYEYIRHRTNGEYIWLRSNVANIVSQLADSLIFFSIAFFDLPGPLLVETILVGWFLKTVVISLGTPFLCFDAYLNKK